VQGGRRSACSPRGEAAIDNEALYISALLTGGQPTHLRLVNREWLSDAWKAVYDFVQEFMRREHCLPSGHTVVQAFAERPPIAGMGLPAAPEGPSYYAQGIRDNAMRMAMETGFTEKVVAPLATFRPTEALRGAQQVASEVARDFREHDQGLILADLSHGVPFRLQDYYRRKKLRDKVGLPYPWPMLTVATGGFRAAELILLLARPNVGKSWLMIVIAVYLYQLGFRVLFISMETPPQGALPKDHRHRVVGQRCIRCFEAGVSPEATCPMASLPNQRLSVRFDAVAGRLPGWRLLTGQLTPLEEDKLIRYFRVAENPAAAGWGDMRIVAAPAVSTLEDVEAECAEYRPDIVLWDSAYLAVEGKGRDVKDPYGDLLKGYKRLLERMAIPGVASWHFNRDVDENAEYASMNDAALTDEVARVGDGLIGAFRPPHLERANEAVLRTLKVRDGIALRGLRIRFSVRDAMDFTELGEGQERPPETRKLGERKPAPAPAPAPSAAKQGAA
jgi:hypothetical protein